MSHLIKETNPVSIGSTTLLLLILKAVLAV